MKDVTCSIDRVSALAYIPDLSYFFKSIELNPYIASSYRSTRQGDFDTNINCTDGTFIQVNSREKKQENVRIDFNPNTLHGRDTLNKVQSVIAFMKHPRMTGIDFAVDYHGYDLSTLSIVPHRAMKTTMYYAASGKLESIAFGAGTGSNRFNFYDKRHKERKVLPKNHPHWWRIEAQRARFKNEDDYFTNPFEGMTYTLPASFPTDMKAVDRAMLVGLQEQPELWNDLGRRQKERLRDLQVQASKSLDPHPSEVFELYKEEMQSQLQEIFTPAYRNSPFYQTI